MLMKSAKLCVLSAAVALVAWPLGAVAATGQAKIGKTFAESVPAPVQVAVDSKAPNVLVWLVDDLGFGQLSSFGGLVDTPNLDRVAQSGLRYTNFHSTPICSASRASLLTGRNPHTVHVGGHSAAAINFPGYDARVPRAAGTLAANLREQGYQTFAIGKWDHLPTEHASAAGPFTYWPSGQGFDRFYGFIAYDADHFTPVLWRDHHPHKPPATPDYHLTTDLADQAITWINERDAALARPPFFLYWATGAVHAPHHAPEAWLQRYRGKFDEGWDVYRERVLARQIERGIVPKGTRLPPRPEGMKAWSELSATEQKMAARAMEAFAAQLAHADEQFGRILQALEKRGELDNTIIVVTADNGASAEGGVNGMVNEHMFLNGLFPSVEQNMKFYDAWGGPQTYPHYPMGWAVAGNTPFRYYKQTGYEGAVRVPLLLQWPQGIEADGELRGQFHHLIDLTPSILEMTGVEAAPEINGEKQMPFDGISLTYSLDQAEAAGRRQTQYFELYGNRSIWHEGWKAVMPHRLQVWDIARPQPITDEGWELYHLERDINELEDLAQAQPQRLKAMVDLFDREARKYGVYPLTNVNEPHALRQTLTREAQQRRNNLWSYVEPVAHIPEGNAPPLHYSSWRVDARVTLPKTGNGVLVALGGHHGGMAVQMNDGALEFAMMNVDLSPFRLRAPARLPAGPVTLSVDFQRLDDGAEITLFADGRELARGKMVAHLPRLSLSASEGFDIGTDSGSTVDAAMAAAPDFNGEIERIDVRIR